MFADANAEFEKNVAGMSEQDRVRWMHQRYARIYLACIESVDRSVGRVLKFLDENGLADNTIVIYTSDQGFYLGEHGWYDKRWVYEQSLRTPLIVRWPGVTKAGSENADIVSPLDFAQTFCEIAGVEAPDDLQGRSLVPVFKGATPDDWRKSHYYHYYEYPGVHMVSRHYAVCTDRYKLIHFYGRDGDEWELVDLKVDPHETKNFYHNPSYAAVRKELHAELERLRKKFQVPHDPGAKLKKSAALQVINKPEVVVKSAIPAQRNDLDPSGKPIAVAASVTPASGDGVVMSQGGGAYGWSLYLDRGKPTFVIRSASVAKQAQAPAKIDLNRKTHIAAVLTPKLTLQMYVDGKRVAEAPGHAIAQKPGHEYSFGRDTMDPVGDYTGPAAFDGTIESPRVIWGALNEAAIADLADE